MPHALKHVDPDKPAGRFARWYAAIAATRPARFMSRHVNWKVDPWLLRLSRGRVSTMHASEIHDPADLERLRKAADRVFPAFANYRRDAAHSHRRIPIIQLQPTQAGRNRGRR